MNKDPVDDGAGYVLLYVLVVNVLHSTSIRDGVWRLLVGLGYGRSKERASLTILAQEADGSSDSLSRMEV